MTLAHFNFRAIQTLGAPSLARRCFCAKGGKPHRRFTILGIALLLCLILCFSSRTSAQAAPSAYEGGSRLWAGAEYSNLNASFPYQSGQRISGFGAFVDMHFYSHIALQGEARFLRFGGFEGTTETNYLIGPRYRFRGYGRLQPFAQCLVGNGRIHYPFQIGNASYFAIAPAAGATWQLSRIFSLQAKYEYQLWPGSPGYANEPAHELTPNGFQIGIAYRLLR
jgi:hypothetical protein